MNNYLQSDDFKRDEIEELKYIESLKKAEILELQAEAELKKLREMVEFQNRIAPLLEKLFKAFEETLKIDAEMQKFIDETPGVISE